MMLIYNQKRKGIYNFDTIRIAFMDDSWCIIGSNLYSSDIILGKYPSRERVQIELDNIANFVPEIYYLGKEEEK